MSTRQQDQHCELDARRIQLAAALKFSREANKPTIAARTFCRHRCPGLAYDRERQRIESGSARGSVTDRTTHTIDDDCPMLCGDIDVGSFNRLKVIACGYLRFEEMPAIYQRRVSSQQLNRRDLNVIAFADGCARTAIRLIGRAAGI